MCLSCNFLEVLEHLVDFKKVFVSFEFIAASYHKAGLILIDGCKTKVQKLPFISKQSQNLFSLFRCRGEEKDSKEFKEKGLKSQKTLLSFY